MAPNKNRKVSKNKSQKKLWVAIAIIAIVIIIVGVYYLIPKPPSKVLLQTSMGDITIELRADMPITTGNFKNLVQHGTFNDTIFHRVIAGFMIQGGDPTGTGYGDPSIPSIPDEFTNNNNNVRGTIAMANAGPNTGSSQFFINLVNNNYLDSKHPVFGTVISGMDVVDTIANVATDSNDKPIANVTILGASILP
jgi:peptidylprolyl isomerase